MPKERYTVVETKIVSDTQGLNGSQNKFPPPKKRPPPTNQSRSTANAFIQFRTKYVATDPSHIQSPDTAATCPETVPSPELTTYNVELCPPLPNLALVGCTKISSPPTIVDCAPALVTTVKNPGSVPSGCVAMYAVPDVFLSKSSKVPLSAFAIMTASPLLVPSELIGKRP